MRYLVTGKEMKLLDQNTSSHYKIPELVLMEQAAMHFVWELCTVLSSQSPRKGIVFCGLGNNGADGIAIARLLIERGIPTHICKIKDFLNEKSQASASFQVQESIYDAYKYPVIGSLDEIQNENYDFVIDAVFGIGLSRNLNDEYIALLDKINYLNGIKIAVDMPSGINSDNGQIMGNAVKCDYTITFSFEKMGQYLWPGCEYAGKTYVVDMGITQKSWLDKKPNYAYLEDKDLSKLPKRVDHSNKGIYGKLLVIAGSKEMAGAAIFCAKAAYRSGVGLVKVFTHEDNRTIIQAAVPESIVATYGNKLNKEELIEHLKWADALVVGPGLGQSSIAKDIVKLVHRTVSVPVVWDADALNIFAQDINQLLLPHTEYIVTPHIGEFSRLTENTVNWIQNHLIESAIDFARTYDLICVLKDFHTFTAVPFGLSYLNLTGNNGMATAGSGDVLAGIIGALLAQGVRGDNAASIGVYLHGLAGDKAKGKNSAHALIASDIIEALQEVWKGTENAEY